MKPINNKKFSGNWSGKAISGLSLNQVSNLLVTDCDATALTFDEYYMDYISESIANKSLQNGIYNVLDFGCGVGRNLFGIHNYLKENKHNNKVELVGYDSLEMLTHLRVYCSEILETFFHEFNNISISHSWNEIKSRYYDVIFANLVFQHLEKSKLEEYLTDIKHITNTLIVNGRSVSDYNDNIWKILFRNGYRTALENEDIPDLSTSDITHHARLIYTWE
jgi:SAM-dependent methyltransferase